MIGWNKEALLRLCCCDNQLYSFRKKNDEPFCGGYVYDVKPSGMRLNRQTCESKSICTFHFDRRFMSRRKLFSSLQTIYCSPRELFTFEMFAMSQVNVCGSILEASINCQSPTPCMVCLFSIRERFVGSS